MKIGFRAKLVLEQFFQRFSHKDGLINKQASMAVSMTVCLLHILVARFIERQQSPSISKIGP